MQAAVIARATVSIMGPGGNHRACSLAEETSHFFE